MNQVESSGLVEQTTSPSNKVQPEARSRIAGFGCWPAALEIGGEGVLIGRPGDRTNGTGLRRSAIRRATLRMPNASPCLWSWSRSAVGSARIDRDWPTEWTGWTVHTHSRESVDELCGLWAVSV